VSFGKRDRMVPFELEITAEDRARAAELRAGGYQQLSRKYRLVARVPAGMTAMDALRKYDPAAAARYLQMAEQWAAEHYRRYLASKNGHEEKLTPGEFAAFREAGGQMSHIALDAESERP
jgi:hypothetical protein